MAYVLAIDTAFAACNVAVVDTASNLITARTEPMARGQSERLVPLINDVINLAGIGYSDLDLIGVTVGPGSFTGVRVGIATARGLGIALNRPVQGVLTTDALAATWYARYPDCAAIQVTIDTKRDDFYVASYRDADDIPLADVTRIGIESAPTTAPGVTRVGDGAPESLSWPDPGVLAQLAHRLYQDKSYARHSNADPVYIRGAETSSPKHYGRILREPLLKMS